MADKPTAEVDDDGRWYPSAGAVPPGRDQAIVTRVAGLELTGRQMVEIHIHPGNGESSASWRMNSSHPLVHRTGPDRYGIIPEPSPRRKGAVNTPAAHRAQSRSLHGTDSLGWHPSR